MGYNIVIMKNLYEDCSEGNLRLITVPKVVGVVLPSLQRHVQ